MPDDFKDMKIAVVHDWLCDYAGAERVTSEILEVFPRADLFAVVDFLADDKRHFFCGKTAKTTFIQRLPKSKTKFRRYLPLMPLAIEQIDMSGYDLVISSSHCVAKGVITGPDQLHISYVHSPIRYAWDLQPQYLRESGLECGMKGWVAKLVLHYMRMWDVRTANGVDFFLANSGYIARRIRKCYRRDAKVLYPPVDVESFTLCREKEDFYLTVSRMVPYKKIDLIVKAFAKMPDKKLLVIGDGPERCKICAASSGNISFLGYQESDVLKDYMQRAKAFVFAAEEDFGIVNVEAQACGTPVIAYGRGGALETVRGMTEQNPTGVFFQEQTVASLTEAVSCFEQRSNLFSPEACRENAMLFSRSVFREKLIEYVKEALQFFHSSSDWEGK